MQRVTSTALPGGSEGTFAAPADAGAASDSSQLQDAAVMRQSASSVTQSVTSTALSGGSEGSFAAPAGAGAASDSSQLQDAAVDRASPTSVVQPSGKPGGAAWALPVMRHKSNASQAARQSEAPKAAILRAEEPQVRPTTASSDLSRRVGSADAGPSGRIATTAYKPRDPGAGSATPVSTKQAASPNAGPMGTGRSAASDGEVTVVHLEPLPAPSATAQRMVLARSPEPGAAVAAPGLVSEANALWPASTERDGAAISELAVAVPRQPGSELSAVAGTSGAQSSASSVSAFSHHAATRLASSAAPRTLLRQPARQDSVEAAYGGMAFRGNRRLSLATQPEITHAVWRRAEIASPQAQGTSWDRQAPGGTSGMLQAATAGPQISGAQTPPSSPTLPARSSAWSQGPKASDITQLANRVYELLVRRLTAEKQRRGL